MEENLIDAYWSAHFVDRRVKEALCALLDGRDKSLICLLRQVEFQGTVYRSSSEPAGIARGTITGRPMSTNGWSFWQYRDEANGVRELDSARQSYLQKQGES